MTFQKKFSAPDQNQRDGRDYLASSHVQVHLLLFSLCLTDSHWQLAFADPNICLQTFTFRREKEGLRDAVPQ